MNRIIRKKNENFTIISNVVLRDNRISLKAKGVIALVMSLPPSWDFSIRGLISIVKEGRDSIYTAINELKKFGYCEVVACRDSKGKLLGNDYVFYEEPIAVEAQCDLPNTDFPDMDKPHTEKPHTDNPDTENPPQIKIEDNKEEKKEKIVPFMEDLFGEVVIPTFDDFYKDYPLKKSKKDAIRAWNKLSDKDKIAAAEKVSEYKTDCDKCERPYRYPATYLNGRTWEDDFSGSGKKGGTNLIDNSSTKFENGFSW